MNQNDTNQHSAGEVMGGDLIILSTKSLILKFMSYSLFWISTINTIFLFTIIIVGLPYVNSAKIPNIGRNLKLLWVLY